MSIKVRICVMMVASVWAVSVADTIESVIVGVFESQDADMITNFVGYFDGARAYHDKG